MQFFTTAAACAAFASLPWLQQEAPRADGARSPRDEEVRTQPAWADFDSDGRQDVIALGPRGGLRLMRNLGEGRFEDVGVALGLAGGGATLARWLDYDGDGRVDLLVGTDAGPSRLYRFENGGFLDVAFESGLTHEGHDLAVTQLDFDGDGQLDLHFRTTSSDVFYRSLGAGAFEAVELGIEAAPSVIGASGAVAGVPDSSEPAARPEKPRTAVAGGRRSALPGSNGRSGGRGTRTSTVLPTDLALMPPDLLPMMALCSPSLQDQNMPANCISASTDPTFGMLYPLGNDFYINDSGRVGIGTIFPSRQLHVAGGALVTDGLDVDTDLTVDGQIFAAGYGTVEDPAIRFDSADDTGFSSPLVDNLVASTQAAEYLRIAPGLVSVSIAGVEAMRVNSARNVGIGTASPSGRLDVSGSGLGTPGAVVRAHNTSPGQGIALYGRSEGTDATMVVTQVGTGSIIRAFNGGAGPAFEVRNSGRVVTTALQITGGGDLVEGFETVDECEPGTVVVIDPTRPGQLRASSCAYDSKVAGVVSGANGINHGIRMGQDGVLDGETLVAMNGRVYVRCTSENGAIEPGDLLTTASLAGHAMKATDTGRSFGAVIGKAMGALDADTGLVLVLVNLQ